MKKINISPEYADKIISYENVYVELPTFYINDKFKLNECNDVKKSVLDFYDRHKKFIKNIYSFMDESFYLPFLLTYIVANYSGYPDHIYEYRYKSNILEEFFKLEYSHCGHKALVLKELCSLFGIKSRIITVENILDGVHSYVEIFCNGQYNVFDPTYGVFHTNSINKTELRPKFMRFVTEDSFVTNFNGEEQVFNRKKKIYSFFGNGFNYGKETVLKLNYPDYSVPAKKIYINSKQVYDIKNDKNIVIEKIPEAVKKVAVIGKGKASKEAVDFCKINGLRIVCFIDDYVKGENIYTQEEFNKSNIDADGVICGFWQRGEFNVNKEVFRIFPAGTQYFDKHITVVKFKS